MSVTTSERSVEAQVRELLEAMTLPEKVGQLNLVNAAGGHVPEWLADGVRSGRIGAVLNEVDLHTVNELQRLAATESRLGIPLLVGRDVIHGFKTVFPIPLGMAATWNPDLARKAAWVSALEAAGSGVNWTFAPMMDIGRDPRWGRVAETFGEEPYLTGRFAAAMVRGFQGDDLSLPGCIGACAKHFAGYGASESGRDYNTTDIPENQLRNVHLPPFKAALDAGALSVMTSFSDIDGVPASASAFLLDRVLREEWGFDGFVVSDWDSIRQLAIHGITGNDRESAVEAARAGLDMEMAGDAYAHHLAVLVEEGVVPEARLDSMVSNVLRAKVRLGLFRDWMTDPFVLPVAGSRPHLNAAKEAALQSIVLLENRDRTLPLDPGALGSVAVIGPLADEPAEQLGTWVFDGDPGLSVTPLQALRGALGDIEVHYVRALETTWSRDRGGFADAVEASGKADVAILFLGEEAILSGEAHCRADIRLPGEQEALIAAIAETGTPVVLVIMAGRPLALQGVPERVDALLYAWHPGSMAGPALVDLLLGVEAPSGKLPVTFPRVTGQIPIYSAQKNTGKPVDPESFIHVEDIDRGTPQLSVGNTSFHMDVHYTPLYPLGYGLSYAEFEYRDLQCAQTVVPLGEVVSVSVEVENTGAVEAEEVVQLYVRDLVGSVTRPVRELKGFQRVRLEPGETRRVSFELGTDDLAFHGRDMVWRTEPGQFHAWVGGSSAATLRTEFEVVGHG
jgi:beta-glucosidase